MEIRLLLSHPENVAKVEALKKEIELNKQEMEREEQKIAAFKERIRALKARLSPQVCSGPLLPVPNPI